MVFVSYVKYCEAECGEYIENFINELLEYRKESRLDVIAKFNNIYVKVSKNTTKDDIYQLLKGGEGDGLAYIDTSKITIPKGFFEDLNTPKLFDWLNSQPTADVVEVVRCKDCEYFDRDYDDSVIGACSNKRQKLRCNENHFCGHGTPK